MLPVLKYFVGLASVACARSYVVRGRRATIFGAGVLAALAGHSIVAHTSRSAWTVRAHRPLANEISAGARRHASALSSDVVRGGPALWLVAPPICTGARGGTGARLGGAGEGCRPVMIGCRP